MTGPADPRPPAARAGELAAAGARAEAARVADGLQLALSALSLIEDRARDLAGDSARVRALGLELLPRSHYVEHCVAALQVQLGPGRSLRRSTRRIRSRVDEIAGLLDRIVEVTATVDVAGELDLPLELVGVAQTGAWTGLAGLRRLRDALDLAGTGTRAPVHATGPRPSRPAELLVATAGRLLPAGSRDRYAEEFRSELCALADGRASSRAQIAHALRLVAVLWSLRRALPAGPGPAGRGRAEIPVARRTALPTSGSAWLRRTVDDWTHRWAVRVELRARERRMAQALAEEQLRPPGHTRDRTRISVRHRLRRR